MYKTKGWCQECCQNSRVIQNGGNRDASRKLPRVTQNLVTIPLSFDVFCVIAVSFHSCYE